MLVKNIRDYYGIRDLYYHDEFLTNFIFKTIKLKNGSHMYTKPNEEFGGNIHYEEYLSYKIDSLARCVCCISSYKISSKYMKFKNLNKLRKRKNKIHSFKTIFFGR